MGDGTSPRGTEKERQIQEAEKGNRSAPTTSPQGTRVPSPTSNAFPQQGARPLPQCLLSPRQPDCTGTTAGPWSPGSRQERRRISTQFPLLAIKPGIGLSTSSKSPANKDHLQLFVLTALFPEAPPEIDVGLSCRQFLFCCVVVPPPLSPAERADL